MMTSLAPTARMPPRKALSQLRPAIGTTRAPSATAIACEPSVLPLSAISPSPSMYRRDQGPLAFAMHRDSVSALLTGIRMVSSAPVREIQPAPLKRAFLRGYVCFDIA